MSAFWGIDAATFAKLPHDNRGGEAITAVVLCMAFATTAVCFRLYTRYFVLNQFWVDDYFAMIGTVSCPKTHPVACAGIILTFSNSLV